VAPSSRPELVDGGQRGVRRAGPGAATDRSANPAGAPGAGISAQLAVLDDSSLTGTGQSSADVLGVPGEVIAGAANLTQRLVHRMHSRVGQTYQAVMVFSSYRRPRK
jgi:hypothetical protein